MKGLLRCKVSEGIFSSEKIVCFKDVDGNTVNGFFNERFIKDGKLIVDILNYAENENKVLVTVVGQNSVGFGFLNSSNVWVARDILEIISDK